MPTTRRTYALSGFAGILLVATTAAGCGNLPWSDAGGRASQQPTSPATSGGTSTSKPGGASTPAPPVSLVPSVDDGAKHVKVSTLVSVKAGAGTVSSVKLSTKHGDAKGTTVVKGSVDADGSSWTAGSALDPGAKYTLTMKGENVAGDVTRTKSTFTTQKLSLKDQTFPTISPAKGNTVGVGMPVILTFDVAVKDRASVEKHLHVTSTGHQVGTWHWYNDKTVHFRPKTWWKTGTKVTATADVNGVRAGGGVYGQKSTSTSFTVGKAVVTKVNLKTDEAKVYINGKLARTIPVSGGKPHWTSRSGTKLIMQKLRMTEMNNESIGATETYDFKVPYAMRVTNSGEFLHAAPWKEGKGIFGHENTSHGCVGMSEANARWLFNRVKLGDPVITTGSKRTLEQGNGWSDWDISYKKYAKGSAL